MNSIFPMNFFRTTDRCDRYNDMETRLEIHGNIINGSTVTDRTTDLKKKKKTEKRLDRASIVKES